MRLLLTADLHFRLHWVRWLIEQAPDFDLICIAGDLLDLFRSETRMEQAREVQTLVEELADIVPVAIVPAIMTTLADSSSTTGHQFMHGSLSSELTEISSPTVPREVRKLDRDDGSLSLLAAKRSQSGSIEVSLFADRPGYRGSFFITFRPKPALPSAVRNWWRQNFSRRISLTTSSQVMIMRFPTLMAKVGIKD
jgi:Icc-related predicted phosphoesterase